MKTVLEAVRRAEPLDFTPFIDAHAHFGRWPATFVPHARDGARLIAEMDRYGCDMIWVSASNPGYADAMAVKNDIVFALAERYPDRVVPYCTLSANEPGRCPAELERALKRGPCVGVKMHRYHQRSYSLRDAFLQPVLEILAEHRLLYMNHDLADPAALEWAAERYPDVTFVSGHLSALVNGMACGRPNLRVCTCAATAPDAVAEEVRRTGRSDTLLCGSDFGLFTLAFGIGAFAYSDMPDDQKRDILGLNALRLLRRTRWFRPEMLAATKEEPTR